MELKFNAQTRIQKPINEVFDAVYNPDKLKEYFATESASGPLIDGETVIWRFADFPGDVQVYVRTVVPNSLITFEWPAQEGGYNTGVEMHFKSLGTNETLVRISESGWRENQQALNSSYDNCQGWTQMSCCLKAFLEYGINLRKGAYHVDDFKNR